MDLWGCLVDLWGLLMDLWGCLMDLRGCLMNMRICFMDCLVCFMDLWGCILDLWGCLLRFVRLPCIFVRMPHIFAMLPHEVARLPHIFAMLPHEVARLPHCFWDYDVHFLKCLVDLGKCLIDFWRMPHRFVTHASWIYDAPFWSLRLADEFERLSYGSVRLCSWLWFSMREDNLNTLQLGKTRPLLWLRSYDN